MCQMTMVKSSQGQAEWEEEGGRVLFIRSGQERPLSKSPFELRFRGGKIMGHMEKNILVIGQQI